MSSYNFILTQEDYNINIAIKSAAISSAQKTPQFTCGVLKHKLR